MCWYEMIVDDDPAIDHDTGASGDFGVRLDADRNNDRVGRKHAAVLELYNLDVTVADESRRLDVQQHPRMPFASTARLSSNAARASSWRSIKRSMR